MSDTKVLCRPVPSVLWPTPPSRLDRHIPKLIKFTTMAAEVSKTPQGNTERRPLDVGFKAL